MGVVVLITEPRIMIMVSVWLFVVLLVTKELASKPWCVFVDMVTKVCMYRITRSTILIRKVLQKLKVIFSDPLMRLPNKSQCPKSLRSQRRARHKRKMSEWTIARLGTKFSLKNSKENLKNLKRFVWLKTWPTVETESLLKRRKKERTTLKTNTIRCQMKEEWRIYIENQFEIKINNDVLKLINDS